MQHSFCIAEKEAWRAKIVLQEGQLYCNRGSLATGGTVLQYSLVGSRFVLQYKLYCELWEGHCSNDTAWGAGRAQAGAGRARLGVLGAGAAGAGARRASERAERWRARGHAAGQAAGVGAQGRAGSGSRSPNTAWTRGARCRPRQGRAGRPAGRACAHSMGVLAGSAGPSWCTVHLAQF